MESRAPANGLKLIVFVVGLFALVAIYGQWQHFHRALTEKAVVISAPAASPSTSPNDQP